MLRRDREHLHHEGATAGSGVGMARPNRYPAHSQLMVNWLAQRAHWELKLGLFVAVVIRRAIP